jgi:hypothetical protein
MELGLKSKGRRMPTLTEQPGTWRRALVIGESAGVVTAMAAEQGVRIPEMDVDRLQDTLEARSVPRRSQ